MNLINSFIKFPVSGFPEFYAQWLAEQARRHKVTTIDDAQLDGNGWCVFNGIFSRLAVNHLTDFIPSNNPFTVSTYVKFASVTGNQFLTSTLTDTSGSGQFFDMYYNGAGGLRVRDDGVGKTYAFSPDIGVEYFIEFSSSAGVDYLFIDGVRVIGTGSWTVNGFYANNGIYIGSQYTGATVLNGSIGRFHWRNGALGNTTDYIPPLRTDPITVDEYTVLALDFVGDAASTRILDSAKPAYGVESPAATPLIANDTTEDDQDQGTTADQALYDPDGRNSEPILLADGTSDEYASGLTVNSGFTYVVACKADTATGTQTLIGDGTNFIGFISGAPACNFGTALTDTTDVSTVWGILVAVIDGANSKLYWNGLEVEAGAAGSNNLGSAYHLSNNGSNYFDGERGDEEVYDQVLTPDQVVERTNELKTKYGI